MLFVGGSWTIWVFGLKWWRKDPGTQIKLLPFFSSVPVAAILNFKMAAIFSIFWPTSQLLSPKMRSKCWQPMFVISWIAIKVLRKLLVISLLAAILYFKMAAIFNIFWTIFQLLSSLGSSKWWQIPMLMMLRDIIKVLGKLLVVVFLVANLHLKMATI